MHARALSSTFTRALLVVMVIPVSLSWPARSARAADAAEQGPFVRLTFPMAPGLPELQRRPSDGSDWSAVCESPCRLTLDPRFDYRIGGRGVVDSDPFRLPSSGRVKVEARVGSSILRDLGTGFEIGGFVFGALGGAVLLLPRDAHNSRTDQTIVGVSFVGMGLLTIALGFALRQFSQTRVAVGPLGEDLRP
jgi:hypothetical protein